jgi:hypothetical protein
VALLKRDVEERAPNEPELDIAELLKCEFSILETAWLVETLDALREEFANELPALRLLVAADSEVELRAPLEFVAEELPRALAKVFEFVEPRAVEFAGPPLRPK